MRKFADTRTSRTDDHRDVAVGTPGKTTLSERVFRQGAGAPSGDARDLVSTAQASHGAPLPAAERATFERSLGADLSSVRVHTGAASEHAAAGLGARAFAHGQDIHFGAGQYRPGDRSGGHLLAHEVAHTVQQGSGGGGDVQAKLEVSEPGDAAEREADRAADAMVRGAPAHVTASGVGAARKVQRVGLDEPGPALPASPAGAAARPMLRAGSTGPAVVELQQKLGVTADGQFGPRTRAAVVAFQQAHGLGADGIVGPNTWAALDGGGAATPSSTGPVPGTGPATGTGTPATTGGKTAGTQSGTGTSALAGNQTTGGEHAIGDQPPAAGPATSGGARAAIVAAARGKIGSVFSDVAAEADETGDKTRKGWETLTEIFNVAYPSFPKQIIKYIKHGKNNGKEGSNPNGLVSWCGIFATWAVMTGGGNCGTWDGGPRCSAMNKITRDPKPGDVGYFTANSHHCIIASVNGDQIETIDGNSYDGSSGGNGAITSRMRSRGDFAGFFKQVDD